MKFHQLVGLQVEWPGDEGLHLIDFELLGVIGQQRKVRGYWRPFEPVGGVSFNSDVTAHQQEGVDASNAAFVHPFPIEVAGQNLIEDHDVSRMRRSEEPLDLKYFLVRS